MPRFEQAAINLLEPITFDTLTTFDALNRPISLTTPDQSIIYPILNEANLLEKVEVKLRGATTRTTFVSNINYDAKGQRQSIEYGNGVNTEYRYDPQTFRLIQLLTTRINNNQPTRLQNLNYTYDPVGNITTIRDDSQQTNYFNGEVVSPSTQYQYDALYRLISASGREHIGQTTQQPPETRSDLKPHYDSNDWTRRNLPHPNDAQAMRNYTETYEYDGVGNILAMIHQAMGGGWTRHYDYEASNNRLRTTSLPGDGNDVKQLPSRYRYDLHGNMIQMPHLPLMQWDFKDQLQATSQQVRNDGGKSEMTYFVYDASGQRIRKITERQADAGQTPKRMKERIYLGGFEIYREYNGDGTTVNLERETLHIMDDQQRIALVETRTQGNDDSSLQLIRYQLGNHLGSASLELSDRGAIVSYEEYYPYGSTSYQGGCSVAEVGLKRYRYTGKERDGETGLYYHGARYYAAWLGRWVSTDPIAIGDGVNLYAYCKNNSIIKLDANGKWEGDMHFGAVYLTGRMAGANHVQALIAAIASQSLDDSPTTSAPDLKIEGLLNNPLRIPSLSPTMIQEGNNRHSLGLTFAESQTVANEGIKRKDILLFGLGMHTVGDFLPHANLSGNSTAGHQVGKNEDGTDSHYLSHDADHTHQNPNKALSTFKIFFTKWNEFLGKDPKVGLPNNQIDKIDKFIKTNGADWTAKTSAFEAAAKSMGVTDSEWEQVYKFYSQPQERVDIMKKAYRSDPSAKLSIDLAQKMWLELKKNDNMFSSEKTVIPIEFTPPEPLDLSKVTQKVPAPVPAVTPLLPPPPPLMKK